MRLCKKFTLYGIIVEQFHIKILNAFFILCFVLAGVSPACAFISGKSSAYIEICSADGSLKKVKISDNETVAALYQFLEKDKPKPEQPQKHAQKDDCGFCFSNTHISKALVSTITMLNSPDYGVVKIGLGSVRFKSVSDFHFQSRAPPYFY